MANSADLNKPTDLDLHGLLRQGMSSSVREGLINGSDFAVISVSHQDSRKRRKIVRAL